MLKRIFSKLLLVAVTVFGILFISGVSAHGLSHEPFGREKEVQERYAEHLLEIREVVGTTVAASRMMLLARCSISSRSSSRL